MLTEKELRDIEYNAINDYISSIQDNRYPDERVKGYIQKWTDADRYYSVPGSCVVPGETIKEWITDKFDSLIDEFLFHSSRSKSLDELAEDADLEDKDTYYNFVFDKCDDIEQSFWSSDIFEELCNNYFEEYGEEY